MKNRHVLYETNDYRVGGGDGDRWGKGGWDRQDSELVDLGDGQGEGVGHGNQKCTA